MAHRLRQAVNHPLLVMNKATTDEAVDDKLLDGNAKAGDLDVNELIAMYAKGGDDAAGTVDPSFATQVLKTLGENRDMSECMICASDIEGEVILPCYHNGRVVPRSTQTFR